MLANVPGRSVEVLSLEFDGAYLVLGLAKFWYKIREKIM
jgi:hypothetical protein